MNIYPAIDLIGGKAVRLRQGDYNDLSVCSDNPLDVAKGFVQAGARLIHVVDLDGAKKGEIVNIETIKALVENNIPIEVGGGIRSIESIQKLLSLGVKRVILGSIVLSDITILEKALAQFGPEKIVVGVDAKKGSVAVHGWLDVSSISAIDLSKTLKEKGVKTIIYTDIAKDGMLAGPNIEETKAIKDASGLEVIASGGVSSLDDVAALVGNADGVIIGKAIYANRFDIKEVIEKFEVK